MTAVLKQASNNTGLALAREVSPSVVNGATVWNPQEPNSYKDFGASYKMVSRNPINASRQMKKGVITDLDVAGGWQEDVTYEAVQNKIEGLMYAAFRRKAEVVVTGISSGEFQVAAGGAAFKAGDLLLASGFAVPGNNGLHTVSAATATEVTPVEAVVNDGGGMIVCVGHQGAAGDLVYTAGNFTLVSTALDFTTLGLIVGEYLCVCDDVAGNNMGANLGMGRISSIAAHAVVFDKVFPADPTLPIIDAAGTGISSRMYYSRVIKNETSGLIQHYTFQAERTLGMDDSTAVMPQAEYLTGCVLNEGLFTFNSADKVTCEWTLLGAKYETRVSSVGPKPGVRPTGAESSAFNTSTDVRFMSMELAGQETPLYAYIMDLSITIKNNAKANKAIGVLGAIDMTEGQFQVSAAATAYFANVTAAEAIANNSNVTLAALIARDNHGILFDLPLVSLGDGAPKITANEAIQLPLDIDAATAVALNPNSDYTMMIMFFDYLPSLIG